MWEDVGFGWPMILFSTVLGFAAVGVFSLSFFKLVFVLYHNGFRRDIATVCLLILSVANLSMLIYLVSALNPYLFLSLLLFSFDQFELFTLSSIPLSFVMFLLAFRQTFLGALLSH